MNFNYEGAIKLRGLLHEYLNALDTARRTDPNSLFMPCFHTACGTKHCAAGWMEVNRNSPEKVYRDTFLRGPDQHGAPFIADDVEAAFAGDSSGRHENRSEASDRFWQALFGEHNPNGPEGVELLSRRANAILFRVERVIEYHERMGPDVPRAQRIYHSKVAA